MERDKRKSSLYITTENPDIRAGMELISNSWQALSQSDGK